MSPRESMQAYRRRIASVERQIDEGIAAEKAERHAEYKRASEERRAKEAARVRFTAADLAGATHIRDYLGWHKVVKVNAKTVTVETAYSWTDRVPVERVLEHRTIS